MSTFDKKGVYHSTLVEATSGGPLTVVFLGDVKKSKYTGKPNYVEFKVLGEEDVHQYQVENATIEAYLANVPRNTPVQLQAFGSRDEATVMATGPAGAPAARPAQQQPAAAPQGNGHTNGQSGFTDHRPEGLARQYYLCLEAATEVLGAFLQKHQGIGATIEPGTRLQVIQNAAATLFIEQNRCTGARPLKSEAKQPVAPPPPPPPPSPFAPDDSDLPF